MTKKEEKKKRGEKRKEGGENKGAALVRSVPREGEGKEKREKVMV